MPYFVFRILQSSPEAAKQLEFQDVFDEYREAKSYVRSRRAEQAPEDSATIKMVFAASEVEAQSRLLEHREAPILREWEK
jgi:hypothetical protein